jgi:hypothetical protein
MVTKTVTKNVTLTKTQVHKLVLMWHKNHEECPKNLDDWVAYLISIQTDSIKKKREFPATADINTPQLNRHFYWLVRSALINNNQEQMKKAFAFCHALRKARADYRTEVTDTSIRKVTNLKKLFVN